MVENIPTWLPELEKWEHSDYDGIKGSPPEWVPQPHKKKFHKASSTLFFTVEENKDDYSEIKLRFDQLVADKKYAIVLALMKDKKDYDADLFFLVELFKAVSLGEEKGLRLLAGEDAVSALHSRQGYKKRDDYQDKQDCQAIAKRLWESKPESTIAALIRSTELATYARKYKGRHTLRDWLSEIDPRTPKMKRGRSKKN